MMPRPSATTGTGTAIAAARARAVVTMNPEAALDIVRSAAPARYPAAVDTAIQGDLLATSIIAHLLLGDEPAAIQAGRRLSQLVAPEAQVAVAVWLLRDPNGDSVAAHLLSGLDCGREGCGHSNAVEFALLTTMRAAGGQAKVRAAEQLVARLPTSAPLRKALSQALRAESRPEDAVAVLVETDDASLRRLAGGQLFDEARFADAVGLLGEDDPLRGFAMVGARTALSHADQLPAFDPAAMGGPQLAALAAEQDGRWADAADAWALASRPVEAWQARLLAGDDPGQPPDGIDGEWLWRRYAVTGTDRPDSAAPSSPRMAVYAEIGNARRIIRAIRHSLPLPKTTSVATTFGMRALVGFARVAETDAVGLGRRLYALPVPPDASVILAGIPAPMPHQSELAPPEHRAAWRRFLQTQTRHGAGTGARVAALRALNSVRTGGAIDPSDLAKAATVLSPAETAMVAAAALSRRMPRAADAARDALSRGSLTSGWQQAAHDLLTCASAAAGSCDLPSESRRDAAQFAGALLASLVMRGLATKAAGTRAAQTIQHRLADVPRNDLDLGPEQAFTLELEWSRRSPDSKGAPGPLLDSYLDASRRRITSKDALLKRLYGPAGRAWMLLEAGRPEAALAVAASLPDSPQSRDARSTSAVALARQAAAIGQVDKALDVLRLHPQRAFRAAPEVAVAIEKHVADRDLEAAIQKGDELLQLAESSTPAKVVQARLLNRRAVRRPVGPGSIDADIRDLTRAVSLDPDNSAARSNLGVSLLSRIANRVEDTGPEKALSELRAVMTGNLNDGDIRQAASQLAVRIGAAFASRRRAEGVFTALRYALQLDPDNDTARDLLMRLR